ncbi:hypothetical protein AUJ14_02840 [Candidatus Micrarchaeota archaeon CG1_02_55_22]|nr:MAG: hypothetical protein AUJ14_02840 [Candidatus Micrarchaeota archaeon CG1_02_55_22]
MFSLRIDIDSRYGLLHGLPNILESLRRHDVKASFFIPTGGESSLADLFRYRGGSRGAMGGVSLPKQEILRMALLPRNFAEENAGWLKDNLIAQGHELGVHAFKHRAWTRALDKIDAAEHVRLATLAFTKIFGFKPSSFAAPAYRTSLAVLEALDREGYVCAGDLPGEHAFHPIIGKKRFNHVQVPVNLRQPSTDPLIESFSSQGMSDDAVISQVCRRIDDAGDYAVLYGHDYFEGAVRPKILDAVLGHVKKQGLQTKTMSQIARVTTTNEEIEMLK